ncbi:hypothetical protein PCL_05993 [Purpureocillium lilacinum]|uniref:Uncharacterized protein n=2 Tax=Purpureocillium lilacinum TaxID=33203 RepID=A0A179GA20_PURLI|nr:hypothetical protein Purlil1_5807 [Purpureocillium lilacinum]OAQ74662.1 hypothetical protein VFPBJ_09957 [Purpureocillium lilacinum]PWI75335.1 hypothetical protein PCL_05993 [Purpureocillium lilacinum]
MSMASIQYNAADSQPPGYSLCLEHGLLHGLEACTANERCSMRMRICKMAQAKSGIFPQSLNREALVQRQQQRGPVAGVQAWGGTRPVQPLVEPATPVQDATKSATMPGAGAVDEADREQTV